MVANSKNMLEEQEKVDLGRYFQKQKTMEKANEVVYNLKKLL